VALGVKLTEQLADAPAPDSVQVGALKLPVTPATDHVTVPVGVVGAPLVSVTVAVHDVAWPTTTVDGVQAMAVEVTWTAMLKTTLVVRDCPLFVPVTTTVKLPGEGNVHVSVAVCVGGRVTLAGLVAQLALSSVRATAPANPPRPVTVIVEVTGTPGLPETGVTPLRAKSVTVTATVVVRDWPLFEPVTVTE